jgi:hypothetical protein
MPKKKTIQGIGPEVADSLQKVLIFFKRRKGQRQGIGYPDGFLQGLIGIPHSVIPNYPTFRRIWPSTEAI